jgi:hypothetical protein
MRVSIDSRTPAADNWGLNRRDTGRDPPYQRYLHLVSVRPGGWVTGWTAVRSHPAPRCS